MSLHLGTTGGPGPAGQRRGRRKTWRSALIAGICAITAGWAAAAGCGSRSELWPVETAAEPDASVPDALPDVPPATGFCAEATYDSGFTDLSLFVVLDRSLSMLDDNRWAEVTAALAAFVDDPGAAGLGIGLQIYPISSNATDCSPDKYATPLVPIGKLPDAAPAIKQALTKVDPYGETPTLPALKGGVQYARAVAIANPKERVVIALVTDGAPNECGSTAEKVAEAEQAALATDPKVLTYVFGLATGYTDDIALMASAGGTGKPILIDDGAAAAQKIVDEMLAVKTAQQSCTFGVPIPPGVTPSATDLSARYRLAADSPEVELAIVPDVGSCAGDGFYPDDIESPGTIKLCPAACAKVQAAPKSQVTVTAGCGMGTDGGLPDASGDAGGCPSNVDFGCVTSCDVCTPNCPPFEQEPPTCVGGAWTCPAGMVSTKGCTTCPDTPHGCCFGSLSVEAASCLGGEWKCPPGDIPFGEPGCSPPEVCTAKLPCPFGMYCDLPDDSCGNGNYHGTCKPTGIACDESPPAVCGCDGLNYENLCSAAQVGVDMDGDNDCSVPPNTFPCGGLWCALGSQVCRKTTDFNQTISNSYKCIDIPVGCGDGCNCKLCDVCPPNGPCGTCGVDLNGGTYLQCTVL